MKREKLLEPDILRTLAFLGVVAQHILGDYARRESISPLSMKAISLTFEFTRFAVPLFVFLFAVMLYYQHFDKLTYLPYLWKRTKQLLIPYAVWTALYLLYSRGIGGLNPKILASALLFSNGAFHLWYVGMIFQFVITAPLLIAVVKKYLDFGVTAVRKYILGILIISVCLAYIGLTPKIQSNISVITDFFFTYRSRVFLSWLVFYFAGAFCGLYYKSFLQLVKKIWIPCGVIVIIALFFIGQQELNWVDAKGTVNFSIVSFLNPGFSLITILEIIILFGISMALSKLRIINNICSFVGGVSYQAYLAHVMCINIVNYYTVSLFSNLPLYYLWLFTATVVFAILIGLAERYILKNIKSLITKNRINADSEPAAIGK